MTRVKRTGADTSGVETKEEIATPPKANTNQLKAANERLRLELAQRKRMEAELKTRARQQAAIAELGQRALVGTQFSILMNEAVYLIVDTLRVEYVGVLELLPDDNMLLLRAGLGWPAELIGHFTVEVTTDLQSGYTLSSGRPVVVADATRETRFKLLPLLQERKVISSITLIIQGRDQPFGILSAHTTLRRTFTEDDVHFLQAIANVLAMAIDRKRAETQVVQHNRALLTLQAAGAAIAYSLDLPYVLNTVTTEMANLLGVETCTIYEWDQRTAAVAVLARHRPGLGSTEETSSKRLPLAEHLLLEQVLVEGRARQMTLRQPDLSPAELAYLQENKVLALLMLPMISQGQAMGLVEVVDDQSERTFTNHEISLAQFLANQAASTIENARLHDETRKMLREQIALREAGAVISSTLELKAVLSHIAEQMGKVVDVTNAYICSFDLEAMTATVLAEYSGPQAGSTVSALDVTYDLAREVPHTLEFLQSGQPGLIHRDDPNLTEIEQAYLHQVDAQTILTIPLQIGGQTIAYAELRDSRRRREFTPAEISLGQGLAQQAAIAIQNARLYYEVEQHLEELTTLNMISQIITSTLDLQEMLAIITGHTLQLLNVAATSVALYDETRGDLWFAAASGESSDFVRGKRLPLGQGIIGWVFQEGEPMLSPDVTKNPYFYDRFDRESNFTTRSILCVPLQTKGQTIGAIEALNKNGVFNQDDLRLMSSLASAAAAAIENARLFKQAQQEIAERKRAEAALQDTIQRLEMANRQAMIYAQELKEEIIERKRAEVALEEERASLAQRVAERTADLSAANTELARAARLKDEFLANMSHELRTPLSAVLGLAEVLKGEIYGPLNQKQLHALNNIEESGRHLLALINDILDLSKIGAGKLELELARVPVATVCEASLRLIRESAKKKQLKVSSTLDNSVTILEADELRLKQILVNLLSNAVKFTPEGGAIGLEVVGDAAHREVHFTVWDTGIGIAREDKPRLFQPFVQLDSRLSRQFSGTGLGLALVQRLVKLHNGTLSVESEVGRGSRFTISLPWREFNQAKRIGG